MKSVSKNDVRRENTRKSILDSASKAFRSQGFAGIGVDAIAKEAGATSGALYAHFGSKKGAFLAAMEIGLEEVLVAIPAFQQDHGNRWVEVFADYYLGADHRQDLTCGCAMTALSPDVIRQNGETQEIYTTMMKQIVTLISNGLDGKKKADRDQRAWNLIGILIGGLTLSRAIGTDSVANKIANSIKQNAIDAAGLTLDLSVS